MLVLQIKQAGVHVEVIAVRRVNEILEICGGAFRLEICDIEIRGLGFGQRPPIQLCDVNGRTPEEGIKHRPRKVMLLRCSCCYR